MIDRLVRNLILALGVVLIVGGTVAKDLAAGAVVAGILLAAGALTGMWFTRGR